MLWRFIAALLVAGICFAISAAPAQTPPSKAAKPPLVHTVIVYLKKDTPPARRDKLVADCHGILGKIPSVRSLWCGSPAEKGSPQFLVTDYHLGLVMLFDDYNGLMAYVNHPAHQKFIVDNETIVEKILVYDFVNQAK